MQETGQTGIGMRVQRSIRAAYQWLDRLSIVEEIAHIFTIMTVANSLMMILGWDQPKEGSFAYLHLLSRLAVVTCVVLLWEYDLVLASLKAWFHRDEGPIEKARLLRAVLSDSITHSLRSNHFSSVSTVFTMLVAVVSAGTVVFQGLLQPLGGLGLYRNLLVLYAVMHVAILGFSSNRSRR